MNQRSLTVGNTEVVFHIPPRLTNKVEREDLDFVAEFVAGTFPSIASPISVFFRQTVRGNNTAPKLAIREHAVDLASGTIGAVMQLSRDRRFEISFGVPKGCKKQDLVALLMVGADGGMEKAESGRDAEEQGVDGARSNEQVSVMQVPTPTPAIVSHNGDINLSDKAELEHAPIDRGRYVRLLTEPSRRIALAADLVKHANPDGSIDGGSISAVLAVHVSLQEDELVAPAYTALVSTAHGNPLLEREVAEDGTKRYWLPGRKPKKSVNHTTVLVKVGPPTPVSDSDNENGGESNRILDECKLGLVAFGRLLDIVGHFSASSEEITNLRTELARAIFDRDHNYDDLRKAQQEISRLKIMVEGLDRVVADHRDHQRRCREIAGELETTKAELSACREEHIKLLSKLKGMKDLLGS